MENKRRPGRPRGPKQTKIAVLIPDDVAAKIARAAEADGKTRHAQARQILCAWAMKKRG